MIYSCFRTSHVIDWSEELHSIRYTLFICMQRVNDHRATHVKCTCTSIL